MAFLYSSVGHGGASGYLAVMALFGIQPQIMKSTALVLNLFVSIIAFYNFYDPKKFQWKLFLPLIIGSIPMAYFGAQIKLADHTYKVLLAFCLLFSILKLLKFNNEKNTINQNQPILLKLGLGVGIGFLSGMLGIGGGIILSPILLLLNWAKMKDTAALAAIFIFANSVSGVISLISKGYIPTHETYIWVIVTVVGGVFGSFYGSKKVPANSLKYLLAVVLLIACAKLVFIKN
jgi:uncharacterized protein